MPVLSRSLGSVRDQLAFTTREEPLEHSGELTLHVGECLGEDLLHSFVHLRDDLEEILPAALEILQLSVEERDVPPSL